MAAKSVSHQLLARRVAVGEARNGPVTLSASMFYTMKEES